MSDTDTTKKTAKKAAAPAVDPVEDPPGAKDADAAVAEVDAQDAAADDKDADVLHGTLAGIDFEFSRKRLDSVQFRRFMQRGRDLLALEYVLGVVTFERLLVALADPDGTTSDESFRKVWPAIDAAAGTGNSPVSST